MASMGVMVSPASQLARDPVPLTSSAQMNCACGKILLRKMFVRAYARPALRGPVETI